MVSGIGTFREYFAGYEDHYAIIGGTACDLLFGEAGLQFRATKDIDMVLCVEVISAEFGQRFLDFLEAGGYQAREKSDRREFFRFIKPTDDSFPYMIELFSRTPTKLDLPEGMNVTRIPVEEDVVSLSAILLDSNYYDALQAGKRIVEGVSILDETLLIPFKARAFIDLQRRRDEGEDIKGDDIRKHRNDVFRLLQLLPGDSAIELSDPIRADLRQFVDLTEGDASLDPRAFKVPFSREEGIALLRSAYRLS